MSGLDSWEDDPAAQDDTLSRQTQQNLNLGQNGRPGGFNANSNSFQPGAQSFQPGQQYQPYGSYQQQQQQYGQYYNQQQQYGGTYPQYGQQGYGQYNQGHGAQNYSPQYGMPQQSFQKSQPSQPTPGKTPIIVKRPTGADPASANTPAPSSKPPTDPLEAPAAPVVKSLSLGGDGTVGKPKVLSIVDTTATPASKKLEEPTPIASDGAKVTAAKAIEKSEKTSTAKPNGKASTPASSGKSSPTPTADLKKVETDAVVKEQAEEVDTEVLAEVYGKEHVNIIFIGHVDAGKSTLGGSILYATGMVDDRTMDKYKREAKEASRESWYLSWVMDLTKEERSKGKTVEVGRGFFETEKRRYTILDAPGHKTFVPSMIGGASQADIGILVISARKGEYETGFEKGGQTRE